MLKVRSIFIFVFSNVVFLFGQEDKEKRMKIDLHLGLNMGATAPIPIPEEVRKIKSYNPKINPKIGVDFNYKLNEKWGVGTGIILEWKGMRVKDEVKYMYTSIVMGDDYFTGYFVGDNMTNVDMSYITIPVYAYYQFNKKWSAKLGVYISKIISSKFEGTVSNGYMRVGTPQGNKIEIDQAIFDFNEETRDYDFGISVGGKYKLNNKLGIYVDMNWGLMPYFYSGNNPIQFTMYNIYGSFGLTYNLK